MKHKIEYNGWIIFLIFLGVIGIKDDLVWVIMLFSSIFYVIAIEYLKSLQNKNLK